MKFEIALYPSDEGYAVCVPSLPGCWSQGASSEKALENISYAIREYLETEKEPPFGSLSNMPSPPSGLPSLYSEAQIQVVEIAD
jgi:predicted RNase H-like HicB family nuclease